MGDACVVHCAFYAFSLFLFPLLNIWLRVSARPVLFVPSLSLRFYALLHLYHVKLSPTIPAVSFVLFRLLLLPCMATFGIICGFQLARYVYGSVQMCIWQHAAIYNVSNIYLCMTVHLLERQAQGQRCQNTNEESIIRIFLHRPPGTCLNCVNFSAPLHFSHVFREVLKLTDL